MKKFKLFILSTLILFQYNITSAKVVGLLKAEKAAKNFYFEKINSLSKTNYNSIFINEYFTEKDNNDILYYVFNINAKAFVIISGTDLSFPVLGYSLQGIYSPENQPENFKFWMENYKIQLKDIIKNNINPDLKTQKLWLHLITDNPDELNILKSENQVEPLITTQWDQGRYYNDYCPEDPAGPDGHVWAGCVATAMAQVMNYYRFPLQGTGSYTYDHPDYGTQYANFGNTHYKWNQIPNSLLSYNDALAELLYHLGVSVDMDYGPNGSGMWNHKAAYSLRTYFNYSPETEYVFRDSTNINWDSLLIAHLNRKMPMYYAGWAGVGSTSGHAFVCDGYQDSCYFHFNWGWSGSYDGYFYLNALNPGGSNFNYAQEVIINCYPDTINFEYPYYFIGDTILTNPVGSFEDGSGPVNNYLNNLNNSWLISPQTQEDSVSYIILDFDKFDTETDNDILTVYDGATTSAPVLGSFSGSDLPETITSSGNKMLICFNTNDNISKPGWLVHYKSVFPVWCHGLTNITQYSDTINDGSLNFNYHSNSTCMWAIHPENIGALTLTFNYFNTEPVNDFVKIYDYQTQELLNEYSGNIIPEPVTYQCPIYIVFKSNKKINCPGWEAYYTTSCVGIDKYSAPEFIVYPNPADELINISVNNNVQGNTILKLFSVKGNIIYKKNIMNNSGKFSNIIDVSDYPKGIYILNITGSNFSENKKIIIQ